MFEPANLSITSALNPSAIPAKAVMLENAGTPGDPAETQPNTGFEAMLALQSAQAQNLAPGTNAAIAILAKAAGQMAGQPASQPATGKILPDAAMPVAAVAANPADAPQGEEAPETPDSDSELAMTGSLPDQAMLVSIFAAPDRLAQKGMDGKKSRSANGTLQADLPNPAKNAQDLAAALKPGRIADTGRNQPANATAVAAAVAVAQTAVMDAEPGTNPLLPQQPVDKMAPATGIAADLQLRTGTTASATTQNQTIAQNMAQTTAQITAQPPEAAAEASAAPAVSAQVSALAKDTGEQAALPDLATDLAAPLIARAADAVTVQETLPTARAEPRAERVDFATLVETLNRAREDASPNTVRVSLAHADFGRVSMRFDQTDNGMQVAMSSADPGFARAVAASNEAASASTTPDNPRNPSSQQAGNGSTTQRDGNRQQQGQQQDTQARPAAQLRDTLRPKDEQASSGGVFA